MAKFIARLRSLGPLGSLVANLLVFVTTNWGAVVSILAGFIVASWADAVSFVQQPAVGAGIEIFLFVLWTIVGVLYLYDRTKPRMVRGAPDYRYGLTFEGFLPAVDTLSDEGWFSVVLQLRNFSQAPIRYTVTDFDVRIGSRALPKQSKPITGYLARGSGKSIAPSKFSKDEMREFFGRRMKGTAEAVIVYGHPEEKPVRRLKLVVNITLHMPTEEGVQTAWGTDIISEQDEAIDVSSP